VSGVSVLVVGISHRSAPVSLLERVTVGLGDAPDVLEGLRSSGPVGEAVVLATCNRVEVYADTEGFHAASTPSATCCRACPASRSTSSSAPVRPLGGPGGPAPVPGRLRARLMVIGESQILGQLRRAYATARDGGAGPTPARAVPEGAQGRQARPQRDRHRPGRRSLVTVGLEGAVAAGGPARRRTALVVGAGSMGSLAGATLLRAGAGEVVVANRTAATPSGSRRRSADAASGSTSSSRRSSRRTSSCRPPGRPASSSGTTSSSGPSPARDGRPRAILDLALPRGHRPLGCRSCRGHGRRPRGLQEQLAATEAGADVESARAIVAQEVREFLAWQRAA
jgi:glutamyl-tRNA reductase